MSEGLVKHTWKTIHTGSKEEKERVFLLAYLRLEEAVYCHYEGNKAGYIFNLQMSLTNADGVHRCLRISPSYLRDFCHRLGLVRK